MPGEREREPSGGPTRPDLAAIRRSIDAEYQEFRREMGLPPAALEHERRPGRRVRRALAVGTAAAAGLTVAAAALLWLAWPRPQERPEAGAPGAVTGRPAPAHVDPRVDVPAPVVSPGPSDSPTPAPSASAEAELRRALEDVLAATNRRDLPALMKHYPDTVPVFYRARHVPREVVRADKAHQFTAADVLAIRAEPPHIALGTDATATMRFRKHYVVRGKGLDRQGIVLHELRWAQTGSGWKIVGERDLRVLASAPPPER